MSRVSPPVGSFFSPLQDPDTWLFGRAVVTDSNSCAAASGSLPSAAGSLVELSGGSLPSSSRPGWQGHTGAKTAETTRYFNIKHYIRV